VLQCAQTDVGPADYVLFVDKQAVGVIEAKPKLGVKRSPQLKISHKDMLTQL
jgi:type I site-specific restriction endonuclease